MTQQKYWKQCQHNAVQLNNSLHLYWLFQIVILGFECCSLTFQRLLEQFRTALHADSAGAILTNATNWEDLEIQEEAESGSSVTSKIRLPVQVGHSASPLMNLRALKIYVGWYSHGKFTPSAAIFVRPVTTLRPVCWGEPGGWSCTATTHPAGASASLLRSSLAALPKPHTASTPGNSQKQLTPTKFSKWWHWIWKL